MEAILKFSLPEDEEQFNIATHAQDFYFILFELDNWLRDLSKYQEKKDISIEEVRDKIYSLLNEYKVGFDMLS